MAYVKYKTKDYAEGQLLAGIWSGAVSCVLNAWQGARFPSLTAGQYFIGTLEQRTGTTVTAKERVLVSARSTDTLTFTRSFGGDTAIAFSANDYFCLHCNSDIIIDIQDEVALKLAINWQLRTGNGAWKVVYNNWSGNEVELALGASWSYLKSNGASSAPSFATPPLDINWQTIIVPVRADYIPFYDVSGAVNGKALMSDFFSYFGGWEDGAVSISGTVTLTRDMYYESLAIPASQTLNTAWYRVFVRTTITGTGTINRNGNAGSNGSGASGGGAGAVLSQWSLNMEVIGGAGGAWAQYSGSIPSTPWVAWTSANSMTNINGVAGGNAGGGTEVWGAGGTSTRGWQYNQMVKPYAIIHGATNGWPLLSIAWSWGGGWCSSKQSTGGAYGGGWGGAGWNGWFIWIAVKDWNFTGTVTATGGAGGAGWTPNSGGWGGWWGGGNGGILFRMYTTLTADCTKTLTGGAGGAWSSWNGAYSGTNWSNGTTGATGETISIVIS